MSEEIKCSKLDLVCPKTGKVILSLAVDGTGGGGLWITGPDGHMVSVYSVKGQTGVGIYSKQSQNDAFGMPICLSVDEHGDGFIQIRKGDKIKHVGFDDFK